MFLTKKAKTSKLKASVFVGPVRCDETDANALVEYLTTPRESPFVVFYVNAHCLNLVLKYKSFGFCINKSQICFCDGFGVVLLSKIFCKKNLSCRNTPPDFINDVYRRLKTLNKKVFFLGSDPDTVEKYCQSIEEKYQGIVAGFHHGFFSSSKSSNDRILQMVNDAKPDLLLVGMGMPKQEKWVESNLQYLPAMNIMTVGALFSWGNSPRSRGPRWMTDNGLEWLYRLFSEPKHVWKRYLIGIPEVFCRLLLFYLKGEGR